MTVPFLKKGDFKAPKSVNDVNFMYDAEGNWRGNFPTYIVFVRFDTKAIIRNVTKLHPT